MKKMVLLIAACLFTLIVRAQVSERFKEQLNAINAIKNDSIRFDSLYHFGRFVSDDDIPSAILIGKDLVREGELHNSDRAIANGNYLLGICYQFLPDFPQALKHYLAALRLQKQLNNVNFEIGTCLDIANVYEETGDLELQKQFILQAKKISDEHLNDPTLGRKRLMIFNNLGTISKKEGNKFGSRGTVSGNFYWYGVGLALAILFAILLCFPGEGSTQWRFTEFF